MSSVCVECPCRVCVSRVASFSGVWRQLAQCRVCVSHVASVAKSRDTDARHCVKCLETPETLATRDTHTLATRDTHTLATQVTPRECRVCVKCLETLETQVSVSRVCRGCVSSVGVESLVSQECVTSSFYCLSQHTPHLYIFIYMYTYNYAHTRTHRRTHLYTTHIHTHAHTYTKKLGVLRLKRLPVLRSRNKRRRTNE